MNPKRVFLWSCPRSLSTAFVRCMENAPGAKIIFEPYPGGQISPAGKAAVPAWGDLFVKNKLEGKFEGAKLVFVKEFGFSMRGRYDMIPEGYQHTLLIKNPHNTFKSYYEVYKKYCGECGDPVELFRDCVLGLEFYKQLLNLYEYLSNTLVSPPIIIDADDLLDNPKAVMEFYCKHIGVDFSETMLTWDEGSYDNWDIPEIAVVKDKIYQFFELSLKAGGFKKNVHPYYSPDVPDVVNQAIMSAVPFFDCLYEARVRFD